ncbi:arginase family protein [Neolewinella litorea]|uniref:Arginase n=1 Tax=Neolewinella litorea TaxID=2562452 RepID=A0A4S4NT41_9BACT|nr:hypothetical protein [Neolewinella litorea]THH41641.1 hypothetical protein E4021_03335 [Neolewinella litorea]
MASPDATPRVALLGWDAATADAVREHLYPLAWDFDGLTLSDLGNFRKQTVNFAVPLLKELHGAGILPVLVGRHPTLLTAQYLAFGELNRQVGICVADSDMHLSDSPGTSTESAGNLDAAIYRDRSPVYHLAHLGSQRQLVGPRLDALFLRRHFERYTLGQSRGKLSDLEPTIRDADVFAFDLAALAAGEAPARRGFHPSGFSVQEAGQLAFYAGSSDRLSSFGLYGYEPGNCSHHEQKVTQAAQAQLIWYFLYGVSQRKGDFPVTTAGLHEYVVDSKVTDRLTFWRSDRSNRWWVQVPVPDEEGEERNRLVSCSYEDYLQISQEGKLPDRLRIAFSRY